MHLPRGFLWKCHVQHASARPKDARSSCSEATSPAQLGQHQSCTSLQGPSPCNAHGALPERPRPGGLALRRARLPRLWRPWLARSAAGRECGEVAGQGRGVGGDDSVLEGQRAARALHGTQWCIETTARAASHSSARCSPTQPARTSETAAGTKASTDEGRGRWVRSRVMPASRSCDCSAEAAPAHAAPAVHHRWEQAQQCSSCSTQLQHACMALHG
jgi:hypothetical protein